MPRSTVGMVGETILARDGGDRVRPVSAEAQNGDRRVAMEACA